MTFPFWGAKSSHLLLKDTKEKTGKFYHDSRKTGWVTANTASAWLGV